MTVSDNLAILAFNFVPSEDAMNLFALTPAFVPTPTFNPHRVIINQVLDFIRKIQWRLSLSFSQDSPRFGICRTGRWLPLRLLSARTKRLTTRLFNGVLALLDKEHSCHFESNLPLPPSEVFSSLSRTGCKPTTADKGGRWTLVPSEAYHTEALRQLRINEFYEPVNDSRSTRSAALRINVLLQQLKDRKFITRREFNYLRPPARPKIRRFKLLPKLHKEKWFLPAMPPGRPIVADTGSASRNAGDLLEYFLHPLCVLLPSHLKDTRHLIAILRETVPPPNALLFTLDVESLYTNVPIDEGIRIVASSFQSHPDRLRPDLTLLTLLRIILNSNVFMYEHTSWIQKHGVAMGQVFGGSFANLFLGEWEKRALDSSVRQPSIWLRFQDDIFGVWQHDHAAFHDFVSHLNAQHPRIRLSPTSGTSVNFLDLTISVKGSSLAYEPFFKDTDSHLVLPPSSHHPSSTFRSLLFGETLRLATNSSSRELFTRARSSVTPIWRKQGYTNTAIRAALKQVLIITGQLLYWGTGMLRCWKPSCGTCPFVHATRTFCDSDSRLTYPITSRLNCDSQGALYIIQCRSCSLKYVGETARSLNARILQHLTAIRSGDSHSRVHQHFTRTCSIRDFSFYGIAAHPKEHTRKAKESEWIAKLGTRTPRGLNTKRSDQPQPTTLVLPFCACSSRIAAAINSWCPRDLCRIAYSRTRNLNELASRPCDDTDCH